MWTTGEFKDLAPLGVCSKGAGNTFASFNPINDFAIFQPAQHYMVFATKLGKFVGALSTSGLHDYDFAYVLALLIGMVYEKVCEGP
jgi:hypothetical protein